MKKYINSCGLVLLLFLFSCKKEEIPTPEQNLDSVEAAIVLDITGDFDGVRREIAIGGDQYIGATYLLEPGDIPNSTEPSTWYFLVYHKDSLDRPLFTFSLINHQFDIADEYLDLVETTDKDELEFFSLPNSDPDQFNKLTISYIPNEKSFYSTANDSNTPISVTESEDTLVDSKTFRILKIEGDLSLSDGFGKQMNVKKFKARIALGS